MELIKSASRRNFWSEVLYIILNLALALGVFALVQSFPQQPYLAVLLVLLSKWRIFAVRPRYWFAHIQSNLVDVAVGLSAVALIFLSEGETTFQLILTALYAAWLLFLKPRSRRQDMIWQAGVAQFVGIVALSSFSHEMPSSVFVLGIWLIAYASVRHVLSTYDEDNISLLSIAYALIFAELAWFYYHWMVAYPLAGIIAVPQLAIIGLLLSFVAQRLYDVLFHKENLTFKQARGPILFFGSVTAVLFMFFTRWNIGV
ncbi:hypothetical protein CYG49_04370 [Candidatus Saccharibacteria bacterium]|nr:MAG: hypothetical protein CYG49_04370 [Candidatus Saccharibacteria bacterium]